MSETDLLFTFYLEAERITSNWEHDYSADADNKCVVAIDGALTRARVGLIERRGEGWWRDLDIEMTRDRERATAAASERGSDE